MQPRLDGIFVSEGGQVARGYVTPGLVSYDILCDLPLLIDLMSLMFH